MQDSGSDTKAILITQVLYLCPLAKKTQEEDEIKERNRNTGHSDEFHVIDGILRYIYQMILENCMLSKDKLISLLKNECISPLNNAITKG